LQFLFQETVGTRILQRSRKSEDLLPVFFGTPPNRSDDEDDEYGSLETETSSKAKNSDKHAEGMYLLSQTGIQEDSKLSRVPERSGEESEGTDNADECNEASMFNTPGPDFEQPVDIEKILDIWIPPEPEDEQDEKETGVFDDEDDDDDGGWGFASFYWQL